jgi:hypothetical protein
MEYKNDFQDWTTVVVRRQFNKKELIQSGRATTELRDPNKNEKIRIAKLDTADGPGPKKRVASESIQELIKKRIELSLTQEKADMKCSFPKNTFRDIESHRHIPTEEQKRRIQIHFGIQLKINTIST